MTWDGEERKKGGINGGKTTPLQGGLKTRGKMLLARKGSARPESCGGVARKKGLLRP